MSKNLLHLDKLEPLEILDWQSIIKCLSNIAYFEPTKETFKRPINCKSSEEILENLCVLDYFFENHQTLTEIGLQVFQSFPIEKHYFESIKLLKKGHILPLSDLHFVCLQIEAWSILRKELKEVTYFDHSLEGKNNLHKLKSTFVKKIRQFIDLKGNINLELHPELSTLYQKLQSLEQKIRRDLSSIQRFDLYKDILQFEGHDIINDKFVVAVRSDSYRSEQGNIIARSNSGMTLFVEPPSLKEQSSNRIKILAKIEEVIAKIERDFCEQLKKHDNLLNSINQHLLDFDLFLSKANFCQEYNLTRPILSQKFEIQLYDFFHPLIPDPITNNLFISDDSQGLVISGPNTGGKTTTLKAIAISQLFLHMGLYLPAKKAILFPCQSLFYFGNDQQSLTDGLSSFASEVTNYLELLDGIKDNSIIIIDEIFNSTSSEEASALALGLLKEIKSKANVKIFLSTHHQILKTLIHGNQEFVSAHVGFNLDQKKPTYKLHTGEPGSSMALQVFRKLSFELKVENSIAKQAKLILDTKQVSYEELLHELSAKKSYLDKVIFQNKSLEEELKNSKKAQEGILYLEKTKIINEYKGKVDKILNRAEALYQKTKIGEITSKKEFFKKSSEIKSNINTEAPNKEIENKEYGSPEISFEAIIKGQIYYSLLLKKNVTVVSIKEKKKEVQIKSGTISIWTGHSSLRKKKNKSKADIQGQIFLSSADSAKIEIDGRGMRLEDFQELVDKSLAPLINDEIPFLNIIHGHGSGILKGWLRKHLQSFNNLTWDSAKGNDGHTRVELK